jgi:hypothetical protein
MLCSHFNFTHINTADKYKYLFNKSPWRFSLHPLSNPFWPSVSLRYQLHPHPSTTIHKSVKLLRVVSPTSVTQKSYGKSFAISRNSWPHQKLSLSELGKKSAGCQIFQLVLKLINIVINVFFKNCITSNLIFLLTFYLN